MLFLREDEIKKIGFLKWNRKRIVVGKLVYSMANMHYKKEPTPLHTHHVLKYTGN